MRKWPSTSSLQSFKPEIDWFHIATRLTVMQQTTKSLPEITRNEEATYEVSAPFLRSLERLKRFLWYGTVYQALQVIQSVEGDLEVAVATSGDGTARKLLKAVEEFHTYIEWNQGFIPNYGERYRHGEGISTGFVESPVNQVVSKRMVKKQQIISARGIPLEHRSYWDLMQKYGQVAARNRCTTVSEAPLRRVEDALKVATELPKMCRRNMPGRRGRRMATAVSPSGEG